VGNPGRCVWGNLMCCRSVCNRVCVQQVWGVWCGGWELRVLRGESMPSLNVSSTRALYRYVRQHCPLFIQLSNITEMPGFTACRMLLLAYACRHRAAARQVSRGRRKCCQPSIPVCSQEPDGVVCRPVVRWGAGVGWGVRRGCRTVWCGRIAGLTRTIQVAACARQRVCRRHEC